MKPSYQIVDIKDSRGYAKCLAKNGQLLLPLVELLEASRLAVDDLIGILGRASIEAVLQLSAAGVAGEKHQGRIEIAAIVRPVVIQGIILKFGSGPIPGGVC